MKGKTPMLIALQRLAAAERDGVRDRIAEVMVVRVLRLNGKTA